MTEAEWLAFEETEDMRSALVRIGSDRKLRLFVAACLRNAFEVLSMAEVSDVVALNEQWAERPFDNAEWMEVRRSLRRPDVLGISPSQRALYMGLNSDAGWAAAGTAWGVAAVFANAALPPGWTPTFRNQWSEQRDLAFGRQYHLFHEIFGNHFRPIAFAPAWRTSDALLLARGIYEDRAFDRMPILADALQMPAATTPTSSTTAAIPSGFTCAGAGSSTSCWGRSERVRESNGATPAGWYTHTDSDTVVIPRVGGPGCKPPGKA